jgi:23S rRNA (adenine2503-C2)-methyltransferase
MSTEKPTNLKGLSARELGEFAAAMGEKPFRGRQLFEWIYNKKAAGFDEMTDIPAAFRRRLAAAAEIGSISLVDSTRSSGDGTTKLLFGLRDGKNVESVLIPPKTAYREEDETPEEEPDTDQRQERERLTLCVSTQVGCPLDCIFCATATMGFGRNLTAGEIVDQVMSAARYARRKITNVVYMGMGEPLLNYDEVMKSAEIISTGLKIAARRITVSTAGWVPGIRRMADERQRVKLAISLHTLDERARTELMPVTKKFPLDGLLDAAQYYYSRTKQRITFEYILFDSWNDSDADVRKLAALMNRIPGKVNIIPFHSIASGPAQGGASGLRPASARKIDAFARKLRDRHVTVFVRSSAGEDINAACGQLAVRHAPRARRAKPGAGPVVPLTTH